MSAYEHEQRIAARMRQLAAALSRRPCPQERRVALDKIDSCLHAAMQGMDRPTLQWLTTVEGNDRINAIATACLEQKP